MSAWVGRLAALLVANLAVAGVLVAQRRDDVRPHRVTVHFTRTVGLYPGSTVRVLGVRVGIIRSITPQGRSVRVELDVDPDVPLPADAGAVIIPPSLVSDRYVQIVPAYTSGPRLPDGAVIPVSRTRTPVELDEVLASLDRFLTALGPDGANAEGALSDLVDVGAKALGDGNGRRLNQTLRDLSAALGALASGRDDLGGVLENLSAFTHTLAENDAQVRQVTSRLATVSEQLAGERRALEAALKNLAIALGEVGELVRGHRAELGQDVESLAQLTRTILRHQRSLTEFLDVNPLTLANLAETVNTERGTLDIRNDSDQTSDPYGIFVCQLLAPILNVSCPPPGDSGRPAAAGPERDPFGIAGMLGSRR